MIVALPRLFSYLFFGSTKTYERISTDERSIVNLHSVDIIAKFAVGIKENQDRFPTLYWLPKGICFGRFVNKWRYFII